ncbi:LTA synthase family protein [Bifidobacterium pseudocatenulatum]|uniref:LTA synthase family protein n=1 Tax=Bifidobacterium pseudocatenulatum TaxID=28026 RepID=UPI0022E7B9E8|nr:alkaline phosphatase family protein [Bifidobacterium pseudocatenulatum]
MKDATMPIYSPDRHTCAPSYVKLTRQPITGGTYRPLADDEDSNACAPSTFSCHHSSKLYTQRSAIHAASDNTSIFISGAGTLPCLPEMASSGSVSKAEIDNNEQIASSELHPHQPAEQPLNQVVSVYKRAAHTTAKTLSTAGHTAVKATKVTGHAIHTAATAVKNAWHTFINFKAVQLIIKFFKKAYGLWKKRHRFSFSFYAIVLVLVTAFEVVFLQWGMYSEPEYPESSEIDDTTRVLQSVIGRTTKFVSQIWIDHQYQALLNFIVLGVIYLTLVLILNRFWVASAIFGTVMTVFAVANHIKIESRNEPVIPADLNFITGGNAGELTSFIPNSSQALVDGAVAGVICFVAICIVMQFLDGRNAVIPCHWLHPFASVKNFAGTITRILAAALSTALVFSFVWGLGADDSWATKFAHNLSDRPQPWNPIADATSNGPAINFLQLAHTKIMDKPEDYSEETMTKIAKKYSKEADSINQSRTTNLTDNTVIMVLSETFSDPTRVPGVSFAEDPIPNIRQIKNETTSGLMLSPGYGGGTANIEYQALTGLSMANYSATLSIAYQQLVPGQKWDQSLNQLWNEKNGEDSSVAFHAYNRNMYFRDINYKKFGFSKFYATDGKPKLTNLYPIDSAWYASDESFYSRVLKKMQSSDGNKFYQVVTMQNHMPYEDIYADNQFKELDTSENLQENERLNIETYTKGLNYTDQSTQDFLNALNNIDRPITVIFYGDHLPGIYSTAYSDSDNILGLHETDYFIWSNNASSAAGTKLDNASSAYTSSNYFSAQLASHLNAKVSPYLAFLTEMHQAIPAMSVPSAAGGSPDKPVYLNAAGARISEKDLSEEAKTLLHNYKLIQYDMSAGKNYLKDTDFVNLPQ